MPRISVIIPVYNSEKYLKDCLLSLLKQSFTDFEIITINDGSSDGSLNVLNYYQHLDSRIRVVTQINKGVSYCRNLGIKLAKGEYLIFVDSDDIVDSNYLSILFTNAIRYNADISICNFSVIYKNASFNNDCKIESGLLDKSKSIEGLYAPGGFGIGLWNKLFRSSLFKGESFPIGKIYEEYFVLYRVFEKNKSNCYFCNEALYYYRERKSSITHTQKAYIYIKEPFIKLLALARDKYPEIIPALSASYAFTLLGVFDTFVKNGYLPKTVGCDLRKEILLNYKSAAEFSTSKSRRAQLFVFKYFPMLYKLAYKFYKQKMNNNLFD